MPFTVYAKTRSTVDVVYLVALDHPASHDTCPGEGVAMRIIMADQRGGQSRAGQGSDQGFRASSLVRAEEKNCRSFYYFSSRCDPS